MASMTPLRLAACGFWLAALLPSAAFSLAAPSSSVPILLAQANFAPASSGGLKPLPSAAPAAQAKPVQGVQTSQAAKPAAPLAATQPAVQSKPLWQELTPAQQQSLKPLAANWATISEAQKRKWLALAKNFQAMAPAEQTKLHSRMTEWAGLSQSQRNQARLNFAETKNLSADQKAANWQAYQALSPEEKQKLAAKAPPAPAGATTAVKPVPAQKLANVPTTRNTPKPPAMASNSHTNSKVDQRTLLPRAPATGDVGATQKN